MTAEKAYAIIDRSRMSDKHKDILKKRWDQDTEGARFTVAGLAIVQSKGVKK